MSGLRNQVLIFEDDSTLGPALKQAFEREGFVAHWTSQPSEAREILDSKPIGTLVIDCLLPEMSGVEFVESIRGKHSNSVLDVILMSGIFGDPSFIKESLRSVSGKHFLKKPFDLSQLTKLVEKPIVASEKNDVNFNPRMALYQMFSQKKITSREKRKAIESLEEIYGFDLPFIYSMLVESHISGHLNLIAESGDVFGISFSNGNITNVDIPDKETYLGKLLVDRGYLHPDDLVTATADKSSRRFGEKLVNNFMVSPHAIDIALALQMSIRLSRTIIDQKVSVNLVDSEVELTRPFIDADVFADFLHDWIVSKISLPWLRAHYAQWMGFSLVHTPSFRPDHPALSAPVVQVLPELFKVITSGSTLSQILDTQKFAEEPFYKAVHYLLTRGLVVFSHSIKNVSSSERLKQLKKIYTQFNGLNKIEIFDLVTQMVSGGKGSPEFIIQEFHRFIGATPATSEKELYGLHQQLTNMAQHSFEFSKSGNREKLRDEMAKAEIEQKMRATQQLEETKNHLQKGAFKVANELLKSVLAVDPKAPKIRIYLAWAKLGMMTADKKAKVIAEVEMDLLQVPPEDKFDAIYSYVQGLLAKAKGESDAALKLFQKTVSSDSNFIAARREVALLSGLNKEKKVDVFNKDLKDVFGSIFKKS